MRNCINATNIRLLSITAARSCIGRDPKQIVIFERQRSLLFWSQLAPNQEVIVPKRAKWQQVDARVRDSSRLGRCVGTICHHVDPQTPCSLFGNHTDPASTSWCNSPAWVVLGHFWRKFLRFLKICHKLLNTNRYRRQWCLVTDTHILVLILWCNNPIQQTPKMDL